MPIYLVRAIIQDDIVPSGPTIIERSSKDIVTNTRGSLLLDFLECCQLSILNGNTLGDVLGEFTSINYNGSSVVDYMAATPNLKHKVTSFEVQNLTKFSDHKPCMCHLSMKTSFTDADDILRNLEDVPKKHKWDSEDPSTSFRFLAIQNRPEFESRISDIAQTKCDTAEDVKRLNKTLVGVFQDMSTQLNGGHRSNPTTGNSRWKKRRPKMRSKTPWFDRDCITAKRELNILAKRYGREPTNQLYRDSYYGHRRFYRSLIKRKKGEFIENLCRDIEEGRNVNWGRFKKLKEMKKRTQNLDAFDMRNFCEFFQALYGKPTLDAHRIEQLRQNMDRNFLQKELVDILDKDISMEELRDCISSTKKKKAVAEDLITNEFLKSSGAHLLKAILNVFNHCLSVGAYPWETSVVTPLHKKGSIYDPNNYRAIAVASNLGKLFSSILLRRLIQFRDISYPDTHNQLGFCKNASTADHILTLSTCIEKYIKVGKKRLYACFVDYAKAFDTVCREALLYKLWKLGIQGRFFRCIETMYTNSSAKIKLLDKLSKKIDVLCGTEQGHPMSPELFKCFVHQLSVDLNTLPNISAPELNSRQITHLLWADDLVLLALTPESLQKMLDVLYTYCSDWGLKVNISKTAVMVFNKSGRLLKEGKAFTFGQTEIPSARAYTYLGIVFSLNGSLKTAQNTLRQKAIRSYFSLKSMIDTRHLKKPILFKLFDALILPVVGYGSQVWLSQTNYIKELASGAHPSLKKFALDPTEKVHLSFLKWTLSVHKFTSNAAIWGDTGRYPLAIELSSQVYTYFNRVSEMESSGSEALVSHAFAEQRALQLSWYKNLIGTLKTLSPNHNQKAGKVLPHSIKKSMMSAFETQWKEDKLSNKKLKFYNTIKDVFERENYISFALNHKQFKRLAQLRTSSHRFNIETGRHGTHKRSSIINRLCNLCCTDDKDTLSNLIELPFFEPIVEDEVHVLSECPHYEDLRRELSDVTRTALSADLTRALKDEIITRDIGKYLVKVNERRFPSKNSR